MVLVLAVVLLSSASVLAVREIKDLKSIDDDWYSVYAGEGDLVIVKVLIRDKSNYNIDLEVYKMDFSRGIFLDFELGNETKIGWPKGPIYTGEEECVIETYPNGTYIPGPNGSFYCDMDASSVYGAELIGISDSASSDEEVVFEAPETGEYYVYVYNSGQIAGGVYDLVIDVKPSVDVPLQVEKNTIFEASAVYTCSNPNGCYNTIAMLDPSPVGRGRVSVLGRIASFFRGIIHKITGLVAGERVPMENEWVDEPFFTISQNPDTGACANLDFGESCLVSWDVKPVGDIGGSYEFSVEFSNNYETVESQVEYVTIGCTPGNEVCDGIDNDCDGLVDEDDPDMISCDDGVFCNGVDYCSNGGCVTGIPLDCSYLDTECVVGVCDESLEQCIAEPIPGLEDTDGDGIPDLCDPDDDNDGVLDADDKCPGTLEGYASEVLRPNHYDSSNLDLTLTFGCSADQILYCKPGENNGEYKFGITPGTFDVWTSQSGWSTDCQVNGIVVNEGEAKPFFENTDDSGLFDILDGDNDGDGIVDSEDSEDDSAGVGGLPGTGKPDWWCDNHPGKC